MGGIKCKEEIDNGHAGATGKLLKNESKVIHRTVKSLIEYLDDADRTELLAVFQEECDFCEEIAKKVESWGYRVRKIAIKHEHDIEKKT